MPKSRPSLSNVFKNRISALAEKLVLEIKIDEDGEGMTIWFPVQDGLTFPIWIDFDGLDEACFSVAHVFSKSVFPIPEELDRLEEVTENYVVGTYRIRARLFSSCLEAPEGFGWRVLARHSGPKWHGWKEQIIVNKWDER